MTNPLLSSPSSPASGPRLPSVRASGALAAVLFAAGIALGAAIGPAPQSSQARPTAGAAVSAVLPALLAARSSTPTACLATTTHTTCPAASPLAAGPPSSPTPTSPSPSPSPTPASAAGARPTGAGGATSSGTQTGAGSAGTAGTSPTTSPAKSPTPSAAPLTGTGTSPTPAPAPLPPIAHVWLVVLAGQGFASAEAEPAADPYLSQLLGQGLLLSDYSPLDASALGTDAALLSGHAPQVSVLTAPGCHEEAASTCPPGSPTGLASTDRYLREEVPQITASTAYREGGLLVLAFAAPGASSATITLATQPQGAWVLSPFLRSHGQSTNPFHPATPRKSLEEVFRG
jgi:hypothetical protein